MPLIYFLPAWKDPKSQIWRAPLQAVAFTSSHHHNVVWKSVIKPCRVVSAACFRCRTLRNLLVLHDGPSAARLTEIPNEAAWPLSRTLAHDVRSPARECSRTALRKTTKETTQGWVSAMPLMRGSQSSSAIPTPQSELHSDHLVR